MSKRKINSAYFSNQISKRSPYVQEMRNAIKLYDESKIEREDTLRKIITMLKSKGAKTNEKGVELLNKYKQIEPARGKINRERMKKAPIQNYYVRGYVKTVSKYSRTRAGETKHYDKEYHDKNPMHRTIPAKSTEDAIQQFNQQANDTFDRGSSSNAPNKNPNLCRASSSDIPRAGNIFSCNSRWNILIEPPVSAYKIPRLNYIFGRPIYHTNWSPQDDTHIFARPDQVLDEIAVLLEKIKVIYAIFDLMLVISLNNSFSFTSLLIIERNCSSTTAISLDRHLIIFSCTLK
jgi:hypothetical protein